MRSLLVLIALGSTAYAETPAAPAAEDHRGVLVSAAVFAGPVATGVAVGAEGELGWGVTPWLALVSRASVAAVFDREGFRELQLGARAWPLVDAPWLSLELHGGRLVFNEEYDCLPGTGNCYGGEGHGYSVGGAARAAVARGRHGSFDLFLAYDEMRWRDATDRTRDGAHGVRLGIGFSIHAAVY